ncbi:MAG: monofunctional biosynthetic peptidoglycan transglycosylase [Sphingomonadaceae bacterium]|nr:monofunctional biosynthetic peptidoglycan transglycosylase [Sphingomonadaceae bacterium]
MTPFEEAASRPANAPRRRSLPVRVAVLGFKTVLWFVLISVAWVLVYGVIPPPTTATMLLDSNGATRDWMGIGTMDRSISIAAIASEDGNFCSHSGFDYEAIRQAWEERQAGRRQRGGSTISQQTAKNVFLWQGGGWVRKGLEAWFTFLIELTWPKARIMEVYLNVAETGIGTYGVNAGAMRYFDHDASQLSDTEAARLAAILPDPKDRPARNPSGWTARYGSSIARRMNIIRGSGMDDCLGGG